VCSTLERAVDGDVCPLVATPVLLYVHSCIELLSENAILHSETVVVCRERDEWVIMYDTEHFLLILHIAS